VGDHVRLQPQVHLLLQRPTKGARELSTQEIKDGLKKIADLGCIFIVFSGGEPLTRPDFFELAWEAKRLGFAIRVYTNGYLVDEIVAKRFKELMPFEIEISFHGSRPESFDRLTGSPDRSIASSRGSATCGPTISRST